MIMTLEMANHKWLTSKEEFVETKTILALS